MEDLKTSLTIEEKQKEWDRVMKDMDNVVDRIGCGMDDNIKEAVVGVIMNGFGTNNSCEGHVKEDGRILLPYIRLDCLGEPEYRWVGEKELKRELMAKYGLKEEWEINDNQEIYDEFSNRNSWVESEEYKEWGNKVFELYKKMTPIIEEFNRLNGCNLSLDGSLTIEFGENSLDGLSSEEQQGILKEAQRQFDLLAKFLKQRYLTS